MKSQPSMISCDSRLREFRRRDFMTDAIAAAVAATAALPSIAAPVIFSELVSAAPDEPVMIKYRTLATLRTPVTGNKLDIPNDLYIHRTLYGSFPVIECCGIIYCILNYRYDTAKSAVVSFLPTGRVLDRLEASVRNVEMITADNANKSMYFHGTGAPMSFSWAQLKLVDYHVTATDLIYIAATWGIHINGNAIYALSQALPTFDCAVFNMSRSRSASLAAMNKSATSGTVATTLGMLTGMIIGAIVAGPPGALAGALAGFAAGLAVGLPLESFRPGFTYVHNETERPSYIAVANPAVGPYALSSTEDLFRPDFIRYGQIRHAGVLMPPAAGSKKVRAYYPVDSNISVLTTDKPPHIKGSGDQIFKYIFAIIKIPDTSELYQVRVHPDNFVPDSSDARNRINHSQLSDGTRLMSLLGKDHMSVYGAGELYLKDGEIVGINGRSGHYYFSFHGKDLEMVTQSLEFIRRLGYETTSLGCTDQAGCFLYLHSPLY